MKITRFGRNITHVLLCNLPSWLDAVAKKKPHWDVRIKLVLKTADGVVTTWVPLAEIKAALDLAETKRIDAALTAHPRGAEFKAAIERLTKGRSPALSGSGCHGAEVSPRLAEIEAALTALPGNQLIEVEVLLGSIEERKEGRRLWKKLRDETLKRYGRTCMACGWDKGRIEVDHIRPWKTFPEGRYDPENLQVLCQWCNLEKKAAGSEEDFRRTGGSSELPKVASRRRPPQ